MGKFDKFNMQHVNNMFKRTGYTPGNTGMGNDKTGPISFKKPNVPAVPALDKLTLPQSTPTIYGTTSGTVQNVLPNSNMWGKMPRYQDGSPDGNKVPEYEPGFPLTLDKAPSFDLQKYQDAIVRDSTTIADRGWLADWMDLKDDVHSPTYRLQINREYRDKLKNQ